MNAGRYAPAADSFRPLSTSILARRTLMRRSLAICDALVIASAFVAAWWLVNTVWNPQPALLSLHLWLLCIIIPLWVATLRCFDLYSSRRFVDLRELLAALTRSQIVSSLMLLSMMYMMKASWVSRMLLQSFLATSFLALLAQRVAVRAILHRFRTRVSFHRPRVLIVSTPQDADRYLSFANQHASMAVDVKGVLIPDQRFNTAPPAELPVLGILSELSCVLDVHVVDEVVVASELDRGSLDRLATACATRGLVMRMMMRVPSPSVGRWHADDLGRGALMLTLSAVPHDPLALAAKRFLDIAGSLAGLVLCAGAWAIYGRRLKRESGSTVLFPQVRIGRNGRRFVLYKFRTMHRDAEERLADLRNQNHMRGPMFKLPHDPRITATGLRLRRRHLDELPQFWNALKGEMSLVGTRPPTEDEASRYHEHHLRRLSMKPGITGLWQVHGNGKVNDFEDVVRLDCEYIDNWSIGMDLRILLRTVKKLFRADAW